MSFFQEVWGIVWSSASWSGSTGILVRLWEHLELVGLAIAAAGAVAFPIGLLVGHTRRGEFLAVNMANAGRALPTFAILFLFVPFSIRAGLGIAFWPTVIALFFLAIPPILTNTYVGVRAVDPDVVEAARGMGMSGRQILTQVEFPLASRLIAAGFRIAMVQVIATAPLGAVAGGGGLGRFIIDGFAIRNFALVFVGALLVALLAVVAEIVMGAAERVLAPRALTGRRRRGGVETMAPAEEPAG